MGIHSCIPLLYHTKLDPTRCVQIWEVMESRWSAHKGLFLLFPNGPVTKKKKQCVVIEAGV